MLKPIQAHAIRIRATNDSNRVERTRLTAEGEPETFEAVWIQVAREGTWKGHTSGTFSFDARAFDEIIRNFRNNPSYQAGADGMGVTDVVAFDFHHESEKSGAHIAQSGAPAQAWALELETRKGEDGTLELWALTRYLEPARTFVREGRYKWTSVAVWPNAKDQVTGLDVGWYLSSIAFTNDPFIQGMAPIAATRQLGAPLTLSSEELVDELRNCLGLPAMASAEDLAAELAKLSGMADGSLPPPAGVDPLEIVAKLRRMLRLPVLTSTQDVLAQALAAVASATQQTQPFAATRENNNTEGHPIMLESLKKLAAERGWPMNDDDVVKKLLAENEAGANFRQKLSAIFNALGLEDGEKGLEELQGKMKQLEELGAMVPELAEMRAEATKAEDDMAEDDAEQVAAAYNIPTQFKSALTLERKAGIELRADDADFVAKLAARKEARKAFLEKYPLPEPGTEHLRQRIAAGETRPTFQSPVLNSAQRPASGPLRPAQKLDATRASVGRLDLSGYEGRNDTERAMTYVRETQPHLSFDEVHAQACVLVRQNRG